MKFLVISLFISGFLFACSDANHSIIGKWKYETHELGNVAVDFLEKGELQLFVNDNLTLSNEYRFEKDTLWTISVTCDGDKGYWGKYLLHFEGNNKFVYEVISDTCERRKLSLHNKVMLRVD